MTDVRNFKFNTDYPVDKIVFLKELTLTPSGGVFSTTIPHSLGAVPFCCGVASNDDFQTTYPSGFEEISESGQYILRRFNVESDDTNIYINGWLEDTSVSPSNTPVRVQVWGFFNESDTWNVPVAPTSAYNAFILNTDYNYPSLINEGLITASGASQSIKHGLGYVPFCEIWQMNDGSWQPELANRWEQITTANMDALQYYPPSITIDENNITFPARSPGSAISKYYYRIYGHDTSI